MGKNAGGRVSSKAPAQAILTSFFHKTLPLLQVVADPSAAVKEDLKSHSKTPKTEKKRGAAKRDAIKQEQQEIPGNSTPQHTAVSSRRSSARSSPEKKETQAKPEPGQEHSVAAHPLLETVADAGIASGSEAMGNRDVPVDTRDKNLSEYEKLRQANIKRNQELLISLDIHTAALPVAQTSPQSKTKQAKKRKMAALEEFMEPRRSGRRLLASQQHEQPLVALPDSWDEGDERKTASRSTKPKAAVEVEDQDWGALEAPPTMTDLLNNLALAQTKVLGHTATQDWKSFAEEKWGKLVSKAKIDDWQLYVSRSHSTRTPLPLHSLNHTLTASPEMTPKEGSPWEHSAERRARPHPPSLPQPSPAVRKTKIHVQHKTHTERNTQNKTHT
jgi:hypothetical protein